MSDPPPKPSYSITKRNRQREERRRGADNPDNDGRTHPVGTSPYSSSSSSSSLSNVLAEPEAATTNDRRPNDLNDPSEILLLVDSDPDDRHPSPPTPRPPPAAAMASGDANNDNYETKPLTSATQPSILLLSSSSSSHHQPKTKPASASTATAITPKYRIVRDVLTHEVVIKATGYEARDKSIPSGLRDCWRSWSFLSLFTGIIPILHWLPKYSLRNNLIGDIIAGFTVAIMNIPHGMAYGLLAGVGPGNGLYMAIFPVLCYMILGTSRHISIGTFAVVSMMTLKVVQTYATEEGVTSAVIPAVNASDTAGAVLESDQAVYTPLEVATALAITTGILHLLMSLFRLGTLSALLSDPLVNGFTTGAACHVIASQLKDVLGVSVPRYKGAFKIIYTLIDLCKSVPKTNIAAFTFCLGIMIFMTLCNEVVKPYLRRFCRFPLPAELVAVVGGTIISMLMQVNAVYGVKLVGDIPSGLPEPSMPRLELIPMLMIDSIAIAIVSCSIVMSMGLTFAKKHNYEVRANQELFALGVGNLVGGCFSCYPLACSLSRSVIQEQTGGKTQLASLVSAGLIVVTLLWAGPFFTDLPRCVLAGVIIVALKPMFMQAKELKKFAKEGKLELLQWLCTFLSVVIIDIDIGLLIGICISFLTLYVKGLKPYSSLLGVIPEAAGVYVDLNHHHNAVELPETKIFRYAGSLNFATGRFYRKALYAKLNLDKTQTKSPRARPADIVPVVSEKNGRLGNGELARLNGISPTTTGDFRCLIVDLSMLSHIDVAGCHTLSEIMKDLNARMGGDVRLFLAAPSDRVYDTLVHSMALGEGPFEIFPTLHDAVEYANAWRTT